MSEENIYEVHTPQAKQEMCQTKTLKTEISIEIIYKLLNVCWSDRPVRQDAGLYEEIKSSLLLLDWSVR